MLPCRLVHLERESGQGPFGFTITGYNPAFLRSVDEGKKIVLLGNPFAVQSRKIVHERSLSYAVLLCNANVTFFFRNNFFSLLMESAQHCTFLQPS